MVKAELSYNPYLQETQIRFNGQSPRINSHVEKYLDKKLQTWIHELPTIFRDEMNGYWFELEFTGTKLDFEELKASFSKAGVSDEQVHLFHKNELDDRDVKLEKLDQLLKWLEAAPIRRYDIKSVRMENFDLLDADYEYIVLHGRVTDTATFDKFHISIENVDHLEELNDTNLHNIPILYVIDKDSVGLMRKDLRALQKRTDISYNQIFFRISPSLSEEKIVREISDLGIQDPQVVQSADDPAVIKYFELFPFTDYIRDAIKLFKGQIVSARDVLTAEINESKKENQEQYQQIDQLDEENARLKESLDKFINPDKTDFSTFFQPTVEEVKNKISGWRNNKTKITRPEEAVRVAREFDRYIQILYQDYLRKMHMILTKSVTTTQVQMRKWYEIANADSGFTPEWLPAPDYEFDTIPQIQNELLNLKEEAYVSPKEDILGMFFKSSTDADSKPILETTFYYAWWRSYALSKVEPYLYRIYGICVAKLIDYFDQLANVYKEHLLTIIKEKESAKYSLSSHLSKEELLLQNDSDWLIKFSDMVKAIATE